MLYNEGRADCTSCGIDVRAAARDYGNAGRSLVRSASAS